jgi:hypothetical protein
MSANKLILIELIIRIINCKVPSRAKNLIFPIFVISKLFFIFTEKELLLITVSGMEKINLKFA